MKYKVGDKVRVRKDIITDKIYGRRVFVEGMCHLIGGVVSINEVLEDSYHIDEEICYITDEMLEDVEEEFKLPENGRWCIKATAENIGILGDYWDKGCGLSKIYSRKDMFPYCVGKYWCSYNLASGNLLFSESPGSNHIIYSKPEGLLEITFGQFKKYVLKESKPTPVKEEVKFEAGKWYKHPVFASTRMDFIKSVKNSNDGPVFANEWIINGRYIEEEGTYPWWDTCVEASLSEIQQYLPEWHPDKVNTLEQSRESLLEEAKRRYPAGTRYYGFNGVVYQIEEKDKLKFFDSGQSIDAVGKAFVCHNSKWAEIVESPKVYEEIRPDLSVKLIPPIQSLLLRDGMYVVGVDPIDFESSKNKGESNSPTNESDFPIISTKRIINFSQLT